MGRCNRPHEDVHGRVVREDSLGETLQHEVGELHDLLRTLARSCWDDPTMDCLRPRQDLSDGT